MTKRLFFLNHDGWYEEEISEKLLHASQEELVLWAYAMMERKNYRNYLITENPERVMRAMRPVHKKVETESQCIGA
jgi:choline kinase